MEIIKKMLRPLVHKYKRIKSRHYLKKKIKKGSQTKILFICQCQHIWEKQRCVVEKLSKNSHFNVTLLIVPDNDIADNTVFEKYALDNNINYIKYYKGILNYIRPHIVVFPRPYDSYLPKDIRSNKIIKKAKTIYIPYGYSFMELGKTNLSRAFIPNISLFFADVSYSHNYFITQQQKEIIDGLQESVDLGFPYLEDLVVNKSYYLNGENKFNIKPSSSLKIIWTPRWVTDETLGGSNFFKYIDCLLEYLLNNSNYNFVFRPHPYAFANFVKTGLISEERKDYYLKSIENSNNSIYDCDNNYLNTFFNSDVLITDISSIIAEYMLTKKPIIFCHNESNEILNSFALKCCDEIFYNAYSFDDIKKYLENIKNGIDPLKEKRNKFIDNFISTQLGTNDRIEKKILEKEGDWFK